MKVNRSRVDEGKKERAGAPGTDETLVELACQGDRAAFDTLCDRHRAGALYTARSILRDDDLVRDAVQEAMVQAYLCLDRLRETGLFGPWLRGIVRNVCLNSLRSWPHTSLDQSGCERESSESRVDPGDLLIHGETARVVRDAIRELPDRQREVIRVFYLEGRDLGETAGLLGVSVDAVKSSLRKARIQLRKALSPHFPSYSVQPRHQKGKSMSVIDVLEEFRAQRQADPAGAYRQLKTHAPDVLGGEKTVQSPEALKAGVEVYGLLRDFSRGADLLRDYLSRPVPSEEEAWARRERCVLLAMAGRRDEAIAEQQALFEWTRSHFPADQLLEVMSSAEIGRAWMDAGRIEEWVELCEAALAGVAGEPENLMARFYLYRSMVLVLARSGRFDDARERARAISALAAESDDPRLRVRMEVEGKIALLRVCAESGDHGEAGRVGDAIIALLNARRAEATTLSDDERREIRTLLHNAASPLYGAKQYDQAIRLFRQAEEMDIRTPYTYFWLAAAVWATTGDREQVLPILHKVATYDAGEDVWRRMAPGSEFASVVDDPEFRAASVL